MRTVTIEKSGNNYTVNPNASGQPTYVSIMQLMMQGYYGG